MGTALLAVHQIAVYQKLAFLAKGGEVRCSSLRVVVLDFFWPPRRSLFCNKTHSSLLQFFIRIVTVFGFGCGLFGFCFFTYSSSVSGAEKEEAQREITLAGGGGFNWILSRSFLLIV